MGNNNVKTTNDVLVKVDHNNLIYIDPNSVLSSSGVVEPRSVKPEELMIYVNLEADLIPRSVLVNNNEKSSLLSIARGTLNFLQNKEGRDYDTKWTNAYTDVSYDFEKESSNQIDGTGQSFGIQNISIQVKGANFIPRVNIKFIDVRGKTLLESPQDSPYSAFFHVPWPIFYLTVKGYYGKAIRYRLHMIKFNSRYNSDNGNFEIDCNFVGSTYAYLADISMEAVLNAPYLYATLSSQEGTLNEKTGEQQRLFTKTSKGYRILRSVYQEYISKGLLPPDFPVKTLREVIITATKLDKILQERIFSEIISPVTLASIKEYETLLTQFESAIIEWKGRYLSPEALTSETKTRVDPISGLQENIEYNKVVGKYKGTLVSVTGTTDHALENIIINYVKRLEENDAFGTKKRGSSDKREKITTKSISCAGLKRIKKFYIVTQGSVGVDIDGVLDEIYLIQKNFVEQRNKLELDLEKQMNEFVKDKDPSKGIGFEPTIRNIIGVLLANAETYIRLLKDVHQRSFDAGSDRKKRLTSVDTDSLKPQDSVFPWPEVKAVTSGGKELVLLYPASKEMIGKLNADNRQLWPEVEFVENFYGVATRKRDPLAGNEDRSESINYIFDSRTDITNEDISVLTNMLGYVPYTNKSYSSIIYEIYERAKYATSLNPFSSDAIVELAETEFINLKNQLIDDIDIVSMLKNNVKIYSSLSEKDTRTLLFLLESVSPFERYPYYKDQLPTIPYLQDGLNKDFNLFKYDKKKDLVTNNVNYEKTTGFLNNYQPEDYRTKIYPFNSSTYLSYLEKSKIDKSDLQLKGILQVNSPDDFITSPTSGSIWVKKSTTNLFDNKIEIDGQYKHILNTPYFHKQLYNDFIKTFPQEKYVGSAYLLLNSLPFVDLDERIEYDTVNPSDVTNKKSILVSTILREISSSHYIPYHLILKWGSIYHRYKKWILDGVDIIDGVTDSIDGGLFFDQNSGLTFTGLTNSITGITRSDENDVGFHPFYETVFHQIVNGYGFFDPNNAVQSYSDSISSGLNKQYYQEPKGLRSWAGIIDNSIIRTDDRRYTILPTNGYVNINASDFINAEQENFRTIWNIGTEYSDEYLNYSGVTFPSYKEYFKTLDNTYSLSTDFRKIIDLTATFKPEILETFEMAFLDFASEKLNEEIPYKPYDVEYTKFQDLLKAIVSVPKGENDPTDTENFLNLIKEKQVKKLVDITNDILSENNLLKLVLSNPREVNDYVFGGFTGIDVENFVIEPYEASQLTTENQNYIELYVGEDIDVYYEEFFLINNVKLNEENILQFRPLIHIYAGWRKDVESSPTNEKFIEYVKDNIVSPPERVIGSRRYKNSSERLNDFLTNLIRKIQSNEFTVPDEKGQSYIELGYNDDPIKLELYNYFKSFNDKWIAGNSIGQRTLMEEFLFLDKANRDIGDSVYIDLTKLIRLKDRGNENINLFSAISLLVQDTGFDIRALPSYVNFYGGNFGKSSRIAPSRTIARNMFGTFLDVDVQDSSPKIILQYIGPTSKHLELSDINNKYRYKNDGFDIGNINKNPIIVAPDVFTKQDFSKSNKVVAFEVSFGDQNQSIFKNIELDQSSIKNTSESFEVLERLGRSETGESTAQIDIGLWDIYRQSSYQCQVTCMGNMMIQPTMFFYLKNIPLFRGTYWITEVSHDIKPNTIETTFKGTRIPSASLPNPEDSFLASYRTLFDKLIRKAIVKVKREQELSGNTGNDSTIITPEGSRIYEVPATPQGWKVVQESGTTSFGVIYNGAKDERHIVKIRRSSGNMGDWLYGKVVELGARNYSIDNSTSMSILSRLDKEVTWKDIDDINDDVYITKFNFSVTSPEEIYDNFELTEFISVHQAVRTNPNIIVVPNTKDFQNNRFSGPISVGPSVSGYGIGLSKRLMTRLNLYDGEYVLFRMR